MPTGDLKSVIDKISNLLNSQHERMKLVDGALKTAEKWPDWDESSAIFQNWVEDSLCGPESNKELLIEKTNNAWSRYKQYENIRLHSKPWIVRRHKLRSLLSNVLPKRVVGTVKSFESWHEVLFGKNTVY